MVKKKYAVNYFDLESFSSSPDSLLLLIDLVLDQGIDGMGLIGATGLKSKSLLLETIRLFVIKLLTNGVLRTCRQFLYR